MQLNSNCPSTAGLRRFAMEGDADDVESLAAHLDQCFSCRDALDRLQNQLGPPDLLPLSARSKKPTGLPSPRSLGSYTLESDVGHGAYGTVYRARHQRTKQLVAIKIFHGHASDPLTTRRLKREAEISGAIDHPNVVKIFDAGSLEGRNYCVFEWLAGGDLNQFVQAPPASFRQIAEILHAVAKGVGALHLAGIIHRDLKPGNVVLNGSGVPKVTDFSVAKILGNPAGASTLSQAVGTPAYMSPEQTGDSPWEISTATDVYGIGAILYTLLLGRTPFEEENPLAMLHAIRSSPVTPPRKLRSDVPRDLETITLKCLEKNPRHRYESAVEVACDLERFLNMQSILARRTPFPLSVWRWCLRRPMAAASLGGIVVSLGLTTTLRISDQREQQRLAVERVLERVMFSAVDHLPEIAKEASAADRAVWKREFEIAWSVQPTDSSSRTRLMLVEPTTWLDSNSPPQAFPPISHPEEALVVARALSNLEADAQVRAIGLLMQVIQRETNRTQRLGAAAILASFTAPTSDRAAIGAVHLNWPEIAGRVAQDLVESPILEAGKWAEQYRAVTHHLVEPIVRLARQNQNLTVGSRDLALDLGWQWSQGNVDLMSEILLASPPSRVQSLVGMLDGDPFVLRNRLRQIYEAGRRANHSDSLDPSSIEELLPLVGEARGTLSPSACILPMIPLDRWEIYRTRFQSCGYSPRSVRPVDTSSGRMIAATFDRSDEPTQIDFDIPEQTVEEAAQRRIRDGWQPISFAHCEAQIQSPITTNREQGTPPDANPMLERGHHTERSMHFTIVWRKSDAFQSRLDFHRNLQDPSSIRPDAKWQHVIEQSCEDWLFRSTILRWSATPGATLGKDAIVSPHQSIALLDKHSPTFTCHWDVVGDALRPMWIHAVSPEEHAAIAESYFKFGYHPWEVILTADAEGSPQVVSYWMCNEQPITLELVRQTAQCAFLCWMLDDGEPLATELMQAHDRSTATQLISLLSSSRDKVAERWPSVVESGNPDLIYSFLLAVGDWSDRELVDFFQGPKLDSLRSLALSHPDSGVHSAAQWLLHRHQPEAQANPTPPSDDPLHKDLRHGNWFISSSGTTFSVIDVKGYQFLGPDNAVPWLYERQRYAKRLEYAYAISCTAVTNAQFQEFLDNFPDHYYIPSTSSPYPSGPCTTISYWDALKYCRWLSEREGIPEDQMCLPPIDQIGPGIEFSEELLSRSGYRLPTQEEWEVACRAGSQTPRFFGREASFLEEYAWTARPEFGHAHPVGRLRPNPWGLFDILGNVYEWTLTVSGLSDHRYPRSLSGEPLLNFQVHEDDAVAAHGGSFLSHPQYNTAGAKHRIRVHSYDANVGFRIARTIR